MSDHMGWNLNLYSLLRLFILQITVIKVDWEFEGICFILLLCFVFSFLCLPSLCLGIGIWGTREKKGFLGRSCMPVGSTVMQALGTFCQPLAMYGEPPSVRFFSMFRGGRG